MAAAEAAAVAPAGFALVALAAAAPAAATTATAARRRGGIAAAGLRQDQADRRRCGNGELAAGGEEPAPGLESGIGRLFVGVHSFISWREVEEWPHGWRATATIFPSPGLSRR